MYATDDQLLEAADRLLRYYNDERTEKEDLERVLLSYMSVAAYHGAEAYSEAEGVMRAYLEPGVPVGHFADTLGKVVARLQRVLAH